MNKLFALVAGFLLLMACSDKKEKEVKEVTPLKVEVRDMKGLKIAFYNSDSLKTGFNYFKKQESYVNSLQAKFEKEVQKRSKEYQNFIFQCNENLKKGLLSENEQMQLQQRAQQMEADLMQYQQTEGAKIESLTVKKLEEISKKIEAFGKQFSEENQIDILLIHGPGGQINYINGSMDVTKSFVEFLNAHQEDIEKSLKK